MNFGQMKTYIAGRLLDPNNTSVTMDVIGQSINESIDYWNKRRFWFNEAFASGQLTRGDNSLPVPSDFAVTSYIDCPVYIEYSQTRYPMAKVSEAQYDSVWIKNGLGLPQVYTRNPDGWKCYPVPDRSYDVYFRYLRSYPPLNDSGDTNDFTENADRFICLWALADLMGEWFQDSKMEEYYRSRADTEYKNLQVQTRKTNQTGRLSIHSCL